MSGLYSASDVSSILEEADLSEPHGGPFQSSNWSLPIEVWAQIFTYLSPRKLVTLRLVCKQWNHIISDESIWTELFRQDFRTSDTFPSVSYSQTWASEYVARLQTQRTWKRNMTTRKHDISFGGVDSLVSFSRVDFLSDKLICFTEGTGDMIICNASDGKRSQQIFGNEYTSRLRAYDINFRYLFGFTDTGVLFLENIGAAVFGNRSSVMKLTLDDANKEPEESPDFTTALCLNHFVIHSTNGVEAVNVTNKGDIYTWSSQGMLIKKLSLDCNLDSVKCDFRNYIIAKGKGLFIIDLNDYSVVKVPLELESRGDLVSCQVDVDFGGRNIILVYPSIVTVIEFSDLNSLRYKHLNVHNGVEIIDLNIQKMAGNKISNRNIYLPGKDGLFCSITLSDSSVLIWDVRNEASDIKPSLHLKFAEMPCPSAVAINNYVIVLAWYNGEARVVNAYTGKLIKKIKPMISLDPYIIPVSKIHLNGDSSIPNGLIVCGQAVQYFQFGDVQTKPKTISLKKKVNSAGTKSVQHDLLDQLEEYEFSKYDNDLQHKRLDKYNGVTCEDYETELSVALALSKSSHEQDQRKSSRDNDPDLELQLALELSATSIQDSEMEEVLKLSLIDQ